MSQKSRNKEGEIKKLFYVCFFLLSMPQAKISFAGIKAECLPDVCADSCMMWMNNWFFLRCQCFLAGKINSRISSPWFKKIIRINFFATFSNKSRLSPALFLLSRLCWWKFDKKKILCRWKQKWDVCLNIKCINYRSCYFKHFDVMRESSKKFKIEYFLCRCF